VFRPQPRAITKSHDDSKLYYTAVPDAIESVQKAGLQLGFFKGKDGKRETKEDRLQRQFARDEL
jgi:hypothetical protein